MAEIRAICADSGAFLSDSVELRDTLSGATGETAISNSAHYLIAEITRAGLAVRTRR